MQLTKADKQPLTPGRLREQLGRLGGTPFKLGELRNMISGDVLLPISEINRLRRAIVQDLMRERARPRRWSLECQAQGIERGIKRRNDSFPAAAVNPQLTVLVRNLAQLDAALRCGVNTLYCDFENPKKYHEALDQFHKSALRTPHSALF